METLRTRFGLSGWQRTAVVVALAALLVGALTATARAMGSGDRALPGVRVGAVGVGGMTRDEALAAVKAYVQPRVARTVTVRAAGETWKVTPASLGRQAAVAAAVDRAVAGPELSWLSGMLHRVSGVGVDHAVPLVWSSDQRKVDRFLDGVASKVALPARDAAVALRGDKVVEQHARAGRELDADRSATALRAALDQGRRSVTLVTRKVEPKVTDAKLDKTIEVDMGANKLRLYDGFKVTRTYRVATGKPGHRTPTGTWEVINKRKNPSWSNPAPNGWGAGMPAYIGPGPTNPLGTRALDLDAPGIRIHGTAAGGSIGSYASHGCIRMHIPESEALFPLVPVGTPVLIHW